MCHQSKMLRGQLCGWRKGSRSPNKPSVGTWGGQGSVLSFRVSGLWGSAALLTPCEADEGLLLSERVGEYTCVVFRKLLFIFDLWDLSPPTRA